MRNLCEITKGNPHNKDGSDNSIIVTTYFLIFFPYLCFRLSFTTIRYFFISLYFLLASISTNHTKKLWIIRSRILQQKLHSSTLKHSDSLSTSCDA